MNSWRLVLATKFKLWLWLQKSRWLVQERHQLYGGWLYLSINCWRFNLKLYFTVLFEIKGKSCCLIHICKDNNCGVLLQKSRCHYRFILEKFLGLKSRNLYVRGFDCSKLSLQSLLSKLEQNFSKTYFTTVGSPMNRTYEYAGVNILKREKWHLKCQRAINVIYPG